MTGRPVRFDDGAAYEQMMGAWSREVGTVFIDWLQPSRGLRWVDVGCGNGAFADLLLAHSAPAALTGIDPSPGQLAYARERCAGTNARFEQGDAMALPFADNSFDAATMALVIFFVPEPAQGVAEMARVVQPGGVIAAYAWDMFGDGFPHHAVQAELKAIGRNSMGPPSPDASRIDTMRSLWTAAGIEAVETRAITVRRSFANFDAYWQATAVGPLAPAFADMDPTALASFKEGVRRRLSAAASGPITVEARANAVKGRVPR